MRKQPSNRATEHLLPRTPFPCRLRAFVIAASFILFLSITSFRADNLGMAHLSLCFRSQVQVPALKLAIGAYERAAALQAKSEAEAAAASIDSTRAITSQSPASGSAATPSGGRSPPPDRPELDAESAGRMGVVRMREMHFNRGIALRFDGRFDQALAAFRLAQLDPRLPVKAEIATTKRRVVQISTALKRASRSRAAKLDSVRESIDAFVRAIRSCRASDGSDGTAASIKEARSAAADSSTDSSAVGAGGASAGGKGSTD